MSDLLPKCPTCGGPLIQKGRARLLVVGLLLAATTQLTRYVPHLLIPTILLSLIGLYLFIWATYGRARWCRNCKTFPGGQ